MDIQGWSIPASSGRTLQAEESTIEKGLRQDYA